MEKIFAKNYLIKNYYPKYTKISKKSPLGKQLNIKKRGAKDLNRYLTKKRYTDGR